MATLILFQERNTIKQTFPIELLRESYGEKKMERGVGESVFFLPFCSLTRTPHPPRPHLSFSLSFQLSHRLSWKGLPVGYKKTGTKNVSSFSECLILPFEFYTWSQSHLFVWSKLIDPFRVNQHSAIGLYKSRLYSSFDITHGIQSVLHLV